MLPAGAFAVALFLNGIQIMLPAPAFVQQGRVWAPGREVLVRLGCHVRWQADTRTMVAVSNGQQLSFAEATPPWPVPATPADALYARREGNLLYVPLLALRNFGVKTTWDSSARCVRVDNPRGTGSSLAAVLSDPIAWLGRPVQLTGEYLGWDSDPFCYATAPGQPVGSGDWVLANADGAIYCTPGPTAARPAVTGLASAARSPLPQLTPYQALGRRLTVGGRVMLATSGVPYLQFDQVTAPVGAAGVTCRLVLDRQECLAGQALGFTFVIYNPGPTELTLPRPDTLSISVAAPGAILHMQEQSLVGLTITDVVPAGGEQEISGRWQIPPDAPAGTYAIIARLTDTLSTHAAHFSVLETTARHEP